MAFPFAHASQLRQQILFAIGSTGLIGAVVPGCSVTQPPVAHQAGAPAGGTGGAGSGGSGALGGQAAPSDAGAHTCMTGTSQRECFTHDELAAKAKFGCGQIPITPTPSDAEISAKFSPDGCLMRQFSCDGCCNLAIADGEPQADGSCCYVFCTGACCGRPFMVEGQPRLAAVSGRSDWLSGSISALRDSASISALRDSASISALRDSASISALRDSASISERIASEWLQDARMEHASIAAFARFTLELLTYGAPAELVEAAQRAGLDEVEHARLCFGLAARYSALERGPAPLSAAGVQIAPSLWDAALAAFQEGCVGETLAALQARTALSRATDLEVRRALERIAQDEAQHAELAWRFLAWAMQRLGAPLAAELRRQLAALSKAPAPVGESESASVQAALHAAGRLSAAEQAQLMQLGLRELIAPCAATLLGLATPQPVLAPASLG
jgi:hypothetical protein